MSNLAARPVPNSERRLISMRAPSESQVVGLDERPRWP